MGSMILAGQYFLVYWTRMINKDMAVQSATLCSQLKNKFMANASAIPHLLGHTILIVGGQVVDQTAGGLFIASTGSKLFWGHKDWGMQLSAVLSMAGIAVLTGPAMYAGDVWAMAAYATTTAGLLYGFCGHWMDRKFSQAETPFVRIMLGQPRQRIRDCFLIAKIPTVVFAVLSHNWPLLAAQGVYSIGDVLLGASKVEAKQRVINSPQPTL